MFELPYIHQIQLAHHTINTSPTHQIKTHHITACHHFARPNNFKSQDFNDYQFLTSIYIIYITVTEIVILIVMELW